MDFWGKWLAYCSFKYHSFSYVKSEIMLYVVASIPTDAKKKKRKK